MEMRTPMGRVRGDGGTSEGPAHWWAQRVSSVALAPLLIWFIVSAVGLVGADFAAFKSWAGIHGNAMLLILFTVVAFYHTVLGLQVVIEDYVHNEAAKIAALVGIKFIAVLSATSCILSVLRLAFGA